MNGFLIGTKVVSKRMQKARWVGAFYKPIYTTAPFDWPSHGLHYKWLVYRNSKARITHNIYPVPADGALYVHVQSMSNYLYRTLYILNLLVNSSQKDTKASSNKKRHVHHRLKPLFEHSLTGECFHLQTILIIVYFCTGNNSFFKNELRQLV